MKSHDYLTAAVIEYVASKDSGAFDPKYAPAIQRKRERERRALTDLAKRGRYFTPAKRPKGFRLRKVKHCYANAARIAMNGRAEYVEGYAVSPDTGSLIHHAWLTTNGSNAIEVTWRDPGTRYFGVVYGSKELAKAMLDRNAFEPMLSDLPEAF